MSGRKPHIPRITICLLIVLVLIMGGYHMIHRDNNIPADVPEQLKQFAEKYPETLDFVRNYPEAHDKVYQIDISGEVKKGEIPLFIQWDKRWGYHPYGDGWIGDSGCGCTCLSMIVCGLTGESEWNPLKTAEFSESHGWYIDGVGTSWELMTTGAELLGLHAQEGEISEEYLKNNLSLKSPMICSMSPGDFTTGGHFIVLRCFDKDGKILVNDPNSRINSQKCWDINILLPQIKKIWKYEV